MKKQLEKLITEYLKEATDAYDEFSHGDATARMYAYANVVKDLKEVINTFEQNNKVETEEQETVLRLLCPKCKSGFITMIEEEEMPLTPHEMIRAANRVPYCECCGKRYIIMIEQEKMIIRVKPERGR